MERQTLMDGHETFAAKESWTETVEAFVIDVAVVDTMRADPATWASLVTE